MKLTAVLSVLVLSIFIESEAFRQGSAGYFWRELIISDKNKVDSRIPKPTEATVKKTTTRKQTTTTRKPTTTTRKPTTTTKPIVLSEDNPIQATTETITKNNSNPNSADAAAAALLKNDIIEKIKGKFQSLDNAVDTLEKNLTEKSEQQREFYQLNIGPVNSLMPYASKFRQLSTDPEMKKYVTNITALTIDLANEVSYATHSSHMIQHILYGFRQALIQSRTEASKLKDEILKIVESSKTFTKDISSESLQISSLSDFGAQKVFECLETSDSLYKKVFTGMQQMVVSGPTFIEKIYSKLSENKDDQWKWSRAATELKSFIDTRRDLTDNIQNFITASKSSLSCIHMIIATIEEERPGLIEGIRKSLN